MVEARTLELGLGGSAMLIVGIILSVFVIAFFCWLLFTLASYALPVFVGFTAAFTAYHHGAGVMGAILIAILVGFATLAAGQIAFALIRAPLLRAGIALVFAGPAAVAGFYATLGIANIGIASQSWCAALALFGAILVGVTAFARMAGFVPPAPDGAGATNAHS
jgi:membrane-associated HD superfamily phosphohydrolase